MRRRRGRSHAVVIAARSTASSQRPADDRGAGQGIRATFGLGDDDRTIATVDTDGVALAAIQGVYRLVQRKDAEIAALRGEVAVLRDAVVALRQAVAR